MGCFSFVYIYAIFTPPKEEGDMKKFLELLEWSLIITMVVSFIGLITEGILWMNGDKPLIMPGLWWFIIIISCLAMTYSIDRKLASE